jgi:hypothetical protein
MGHQGVTGSSLAGVTMLSCGEHGSHAKKDSAVPTGKEEVRTSGEEGRKAETEAPREEAAGATAAAAPGKGAGRLLVVSLPSSVEATTFELVELDNSAELRAYLSVPGRSAVIFEHAKMVFTEDDPRLTSPVKEPAPGAAAEETGAAPRLPTAFRRPLLRGPSGHVGLTKSASRLPRHRLIELATYACVDSVSADILRRHAMNETARHCEVRVAHNAEEKVFWVDAQAPLHRLVRTCLAAPWRSPLDKAGRKYTLRTAGDGHVDLGAPLSELQEGSPLKLVDAGPAVHDLALEDGALAAEDPAAAAAADGALLAAPGVARHDCQQQPVKRSRGRPRKRPLEDLNSAPAPSPPDPSTPPAPSSAHAASPSEAPAKASSTRTASSGDPAPAAKKKKGPAPAQSSASVNYVEDEDGGAAPQPALPAPTPVKRKRGRPRKHPLPPTVEESAAVAPLGKPPASPPEARERLGSASEGSEELGDGIVTPTPSLVSSALPGVRVATRLTRRRIKADDDL